MEKNNELEQALHEASNLPNLTDKPAGDIPEDIAVYVNQVFPGFLGRIDCAGIPGD